MSAKKHTNFLLVIIIVSLSLFILLCPRKINGPSTTTTGTTKENFSYTNQDYVPQQLDEYYLHKEDLEQILKTHMKCSDEYNKNQKIIEMNMEYDTRGDNNDLINLNLLSANSDAAAGAFFM